MVSLAPKFDLNYADPEHASTLCPPPEPRLRAVQCAPLRPPPSTAAWAARRFSPQHTMQHSQDAPTALKGRTRTVPERHRRLGVPSEDPPSDRRSASRDSIMTVSPNKSERQRLHRCPLLAWKCMQTAPVRRTQAEHRTCVMLRRPACELVIFPFLLFGAVSCQRALVVVHRGVRIQSLHLL